MYSLSHVLAAILKKQKQTSSIYKLSLLLGVSQICFWHSDASLITITTAEGHAIIASNDLQYHKWAKKYHQTYVKK